MFPRFRIVRVATHAGEMGGAVDRDARRTVAHQMQEGTQPKGASLPDTNAPKTGPPTTTHVINAETVTDTATKPPKRPPTDLNPAVKPLARGLAWGVGGAGVGLAALGLGSLAESIGEGVYHAGEKQLPYTQTLPDGSLLYTDPVTGETYVIVVKDGGADHQDGSGSEGGGVDVVPVTPGHRAEAEATEAVFSIFDHPWVLLGIVACLTVILIVWSRKSAGQPTATRKGATA